MLTSSSCRLIVQMRHIWKPSGAGTWIRAITCEARSPKFIDLPAIPQFLEDYTTLSSVLSRGIKEEFESNDSVYDDEFNVNNYSFSVQLKWEAKHKLINVEEEALIYNRGKYSESDIACSFLKVLNTDNPEDTVKLFNLLSKNPKHCVDLISAAWTIAVLEARPNVKEAVNSWENIASLTLSKAGINYLWEYILKDDKYKSRIIRKVLIVCKEIQSPSETIAQIISALVKIKKISQANLIFSKFFIDGQSFKRPLEKLVKETDLATIEQLAQMFSYYCSAELKRKKKSPEREEDQVDTNTRILLNEINRFSGISLLAGVSNIAEEKKKPKRNRVNEHYLFYLLNFTRDAWQKLAKDRFSRERCRRWCESVYIDVRGQEPE